MSDRVIYTREEIESRVKVPSIVEAELKRLVEERLKQCGLYYRLFSRIKTADSLSRKYQIKEYNEEKKIQDLIGLRIDVYFEDDLKICQKILTDMFVLIEWTKSEQNDDEFRPMKINGVFQLPQYLKSQISEDTWGMCIDDTIEIQLKTVFFEGWHEIEHDMKYKGGELWSGRNGFSRYFNSILATLELCDKSVVSLFENLGHDLYKEGNWYGMMKAHYRLKMDERPMYPELENYLNTSTGENNLGKQLFKTSRQVVIDELLKQPRRVPINVNTIAALVNKAVIHDQRLTLMFHQKDVFDDGNDNPGEEVSFRKMEPLLKNNVFYANVSLSTQKYGAKEACLEAARLTYQWMYEKYGGLFPGLPQEPASIDRKDMLGYRLLFSYEPENLLWKMKATNLDLEAPGQVWVAEACCWNDEGRQRLTVRNSYAVAQERRNYLNRYFSCPRFYSNIADRIGVMDVEYCSTSRRILQDQDVGKVKDLIRHSERTFPVCIFVSRNQGNGWLDEGWLEQFRVYDFTRMAGRYTHIYTCSLEVAGHLFWDLGMPWDGQSGVHIFRSGCLDAEGKIDSEHHIVYNARDVQECRYGRHQLRNEGRRYDIVTGGQAFYYKLLHEMRDEMFADHGQDVSMDMGDSTIA